MPRRNIFDLSQERRLFIVYIDKCKTREHRYENQVTHRGTFANDLCVCAEDPFVDA